MGKEAISLRLENLPEMMPLMVAEQAFPPARPLALLLAGMCGGVVEFIHPGGVFRGCLFLKKEASAPGHAMGSWQYLAGVDNVPWQGNLVGRALLGKLLHHYLQGSPQKTPAAAGPSSSGLSLAFTITYRAWSGLLSSVLGIAFRVSLVPGQGHSAIKQYYSLIGNSLCLFVFFIFVVVVVAFPFEAGSHFIAPANLEIVIRICLSPTCRHQGASASQAQGLKLGAIVLVYKFILDRLPRLALNSLYRPGTT